MIQRSIISAGVGIFLATGGAWAQNPTLTENLNNTGIPRQVPSIGLPAIYGLNPCSTGTSVGVATPLFGIGGAVSSIDHECETRNNAAVVITGLKDEVLGREILCEIKDVREAAIRVGKPCRPDNAEQRISAAEPVKPPEPPNGAVPAPTLVLGTPPAAAEPRRPQVAALRPGAPVFCRVKDLDLSLYPDCTTQTAPTSTVGSADGPKHSAKAASARPAPKVKAADAKTIHRRPDIASVKSMAFADSHGASVRGPDPALLAAVERNLARLIEIRRVELAEAAHRAEPPAPTTQAPAPRGPMLAAATVGD